ncbi:MAG: hypothetical protein ABFC54_00430 [Thermoguttaceae bacterium]
MNEAVLRELKGVAQQAVEPVRATLDRKRRMREELLAHLTTIFGEEKKKLADQRTALDRTKLRFGAPSELAAQLQETVPQGDRLLAILENMGCRPGESAWRLAARHFSFALIICAVWTPIWLWLHGVMTLPGPPESRRLYAVVLIAAVPLIALFNVFFSVLLAPLLDKIGPRLALTRRGRMALVGLSAWIVLCGMALPPYWIAASILFAMAARRSMKQWRYDVESG